jgi:hypothetical protein
MQGQRYAFNFFQTALLKIEMLDKKGQKKFATGSEVIPNY